MYVKLTKSTSRISFAKFNLKKKEAFDDKLKLSNANDYRIFIKTLQKNLSLYEENKNRIH